MRRLFLTLSNHGGGVGCAGPKACMTRTGSTTRTDGLVPLISSQVRLHAPPADRSFLPAWLAAPLRIRRSVAGSGSGNYGDDPSRRSSGSGDGAQAAASRRSADWGRGLSSVAEAAPPAPGASAFLRRLGRFHSVDEEVAMRAMGGNAAPGGGPAQLPLPTARAPAVTYLLRETPCCVLFSGLIARFDPALSCILPLSAVNIALVLTPASERV